MIRIKLSSILPALLIASNLSIKKKTARANKIPMGIMSGPPLPNKLQTDSTLPAELAAVLRESTCKIISIME